MQINYVDETGPEAWVTFSEKLSCPNQHPIQLTEIEPRTFSFNAPFGACPECSGLGTRMSVDDDLLLGDPSLSIAEGVILPWTSQGKSLYNYYEKLLGGLARDLDFSLDTPWEELPTRRAPGGAARRQLRGQGQVAQPLRPRDELHLRLRGRRARTSSASTCRPRPTCSARGGPSTSARCRARSATASG